MSASPSASRICLGTAQLGLDYGIANARGRPDDSTCEAIVVRAIERGVRHFDTARSYGDAEQRLGNILAKHPLRDEIRIVSKLPSPPSDLPPNNVLDWVTREITDSLQRLRIEQLAAWLVHDATTMDNFGSAIWDAMVAQLDRGVTREIGLSVYDENELRSALNRRETSTVQLPLNLLDHRCAESGLLDEAKQRGVTVYARSVLLQGLFAMSLSQVPDALTQAKAPLKQLHEILRKNRLTPLDVALPWVLAQAQVDFAVIGVDNVQQLDDNLACAEGRLPVGLHDELRATFSRVPTEILEPRRW